MASLSELPDVLTVNEVAAVLRIGRSAAYGIFHEWETTGGERGLRCFRVGRSLRATRKDVLSYITSGGTRRPYPLPTSPTATVREFPQRAPRRISQAR